MAEDVRPIRVDPERRSFLGHLFGCEASCDSSVGRADRPALPRTIRTDAGFTLVELLVVIAIVGIVMSLLLPGLMMAKQAGLRSACQNILHQQGIAIQRCVQVTGRLPWGSRTSKDGPTDGSSLWAELIPYTDDNAFWGPVIKRHKGDGQPELWGSSKTFDPTKNDKIYISGAKVSFVSCPATPLPRMVFYGTVENFEAMDADNDELITYNSWGDLWVQCSDYSGVCGSIHGRQRAVGRNNNGIRSFSGLFTSYAAGAGVGDDYTAEGGLEGGRGLYPISPAEVVDGLSKTMAVAETSGLRRNYGKPINLSDIMLDLSRTRGQLVATQNWGRTAQHWLLGVAEGDGYLKSPNLTTMRYRPGTPFPAYEPDVRVGQPPPPPPPEPLPPPQPGVGIGGPNMPINSAHGEGGNVSMADGSVHYFNNEIDLDVLYYLADRDDRHAVTIPGR